MPMYLGNDKIIPVVPTDTSDATATAEDILAGKTAYGATGKLTGTIPTKTGETITPGTENQTISGGQYLTGDITVEGDADLVAGNIKSGVSLFGVAGSFTEDADATAADIAMGKMAYVDGEKVTGTAQKFTITEEQTELTAINYGTNTGGSDYNGWKNTFSINKNFPLRMQNYLLIPTKIRFYGYYYNGSTYMQDSTYATYKEYELTTESAVAGLKAKYDWYHYSQGENAALRIYLPSREMAYYESNEKGTKVITYYKKVSI